MPSSQSFYILWNMGTAVPIPRRPLRSLTPFSLWRMSLFGFLPASTTIDRQPPRIVQELPLPGQLMVFVCPYKPLFFLCILNPISSNVFITSKLIGIMCPFLRVSPIRMAQNLSLFNTR